MFLLPVSSVQAQQKNNGQPLAEAVEATAVPPVVVQQLQRIAPNFQEPSWEHYTCEQCVKEIADNYYKVDFFQEDKPASLTIDVTGKILAFQLRVKLADLPSPVQQVVSKRAKKMQQEFQGVELEMYSFTEGARVLYNIVFYIPTEDKKHWTPYDEINTNDKGLLVKQTP